MYYKFTKKWKFKNKYYPASNPVYLYYPALPDPEPVSQIPVPALPELERLFLKSGSGNKQFWNLCSHWFSF